MNINESDVKELISSIRNLTDEIEKNNKAISKDEIPNLEKNFTYYIKRYFQELFEAGIGLLLVMFILKKKIEVFDFFKMISLIGLVTLILEEYNVEYLTNFKQGIHFTLGSLAFNN
jgi:hypothetical protein